jgi:hypothetical protein
MELMLSISSAPPDVTTALKLMFTALELVVIAAGIFVFRIRKKLFSYQGQEGDTYASANLRLAMVVLIWVHAVILGAIMIFEI